MPPTNPRPLSAIPALNARIELLRADITTLSVGAIVNAANTSLLGGGGVDGAIHARAGPDLLAACRPLGGCATGDAKITPAGRLPCERVIHAVGPVYRAEREREEGREERLLRGCYTKALQLARENGLKSIAFSCLSAGVYGYPSRAAATVACRAVREWLVERETEDWGGIERVVFCCFEPHDEEAYREVLPYFFPPADAAAPAAGSTANDVTTDATEAPQPSIADAAAASPPTSPSADHYTPHHPTAKKAKLGSPAAAAAAATPHDETEWEPVERGRASAPNGRAERPFDDDDAETLGFLVGALYLGWRMAPDHFRWQLAHRTLGALVLLWSVAFLFLALGLMPLRAQLNRNFDRRVQIGELAWMREQAAKTK